MNHPGEVDLALLAGGDLGVWARLRMAVHLGRCAACRGEVEEFRAGQEWIRRASAEVPAEINWNRLAGEMKANIRLGLAAGQCVDPAGRVRAGIGWRPIAVLASTLLVAVALWWLKPGDRDALGGGRTSGPELAGPSSSEGVVLEATPRGIELRQNGRMLRLTHPDGEDVTVSVSLQGSLRARYVDSETGQVTINHVYTQ